MARNGCSLSLVVSYTVGKPMERRFNKDQKVFDLPRPLHDQLKIGPRPKMAQTILSLKMSQHGCSSSTILSESLQEADLKYEF